MADDMTEKEITKIYIDDSLVAQMQTMQLLKELKARVPASHFRYEVVDYKFTQFIFKIPTQVWHQATKRVEK